MPENVDGGDVVLVEVQFYHSYKATIDATVKFPVSFPVQLQSSALVNFFRPVQFLEPLEGILKWPLLSLLHFLGDLRGCIL